MAGIFDLPTQASSGPSVVDFHYERIQSTSDLKNIVGNTHIFRIEPSGTDWWYPQKSYFRARLKMVVGFNEVKFPSFSSVAALATASKLKQPAPWPFPFNAPNAFLDTGQAVAVYTEAKGVHQGREQKNNGNQGVETNTIDRIACGWRGDAAMHVTRGQADGVLPGNADGWNFTERKPLDNSSHETSIGLTYYTDFKPFTAMKFVELADCAMDAFFDQISFSVGPQRVETIQRPQLLNVYKHRTSHSTDTNKTRFNTLGVWGDNQYPDIRFNNRSTSNSKSVFDVLGYSNINVTQNSSWTDEYTVTFDVLYVPPLGVFDIEHALPPARYEIELKGTASYTEVNNNFFHCTMPGALGRWHMDKTDANDLDPGALNRKGPATFLDDKHAVGRGSSTSQHAPRTLFFYEPPIGAGAYLNEKSIANHYLGRGQIQDSFLTADSERSDPGFFLSIQCVDMALECAMVAGNLLTDSQFVLQYDSYQTQFIPLGSSSTQNLIYDVEPFANFFSFGFRTTNVNDDVCLQAGHMICAANAERDLKQYYINFDMKTRPVNFATEINLKSERGALNELVRSQINDYILFSDSPETVRGWLKKGPLYSHNWPRDGTSNATRFMLQLEFDTGPCDSMGPHGQFENEMPLVFVNAAAPFKAPSKTITGNSSDGSATWESAAVNTRSNHYILSHRAYAAVKQHEALDVLYGQAWRVPDLWYSLYYPATKNLLFRQSRIDCADRAETSYFRTTNNAALNDDTFDISGVFREATINNQKHKGWQTVPSIYKIDSGVRGTEHSRPRDLSLANAENSCILFQTIPKIILINTSMGRVTAVRTIDNRM